jgi:CRP-like cAMP-binding protein
MKEVKEILDYLCSIRKLSPECLKQLEEFIKKQEVKKDELILKVGEINNRLYFIYSGSLHCFYYVGEKEVSDWFFFEREFTVSIGSFYDQTPSEDCIVAFEDSVLFYLTWEQYELLCETHPSFNSLARILLQKYLKVFHSHPRFIRKHTAAERVRLVLAKMSAVIHRIPQAALASWLSMEPETLSRNRT